MTRSEPPAEVFSDIDLAALIESHEAWTGYTVFKSFTIDCLRELQRLRASSSLGGIEGGVARAEDGAPHPDEPLITGKMHWQPMESAPKDGTWFLICRAGDAFDSYEVGCFEPLLHDEYVEVGDNLYRKEKKSLYDWRGFNNPHRATHWMPLPEPPK